MSFSNARVIRHFDRVAEFYGAGGYNQRRYQAVLDAIAPELRDARNILELGCAAGHVAAELAARAPQAMLVAADIAPRMLTAARSRVPSRVALVLGDASHPPLKNASQDLVFCSHVLRFVPELEQSVREIARLLRPGGTLATTVGTNQIIQMIGDRGRRAIGARHLLLAVMMRLFSEGRVLRTRSHPRNGPQALVAGGLGFEWINAEFTVTRAEIIEFLSSKFRPGTRALGGWLLKHIVFGARDPDALLPANERILLGRKPA
jgi:SAM-dependent methyltransferase